MLTLRESMPPNTRNGKNLIRLENRAPLARRGQTAGYYAAIIKTRT
jgi:hypothetical protein